MHAGHRLPVLLWLNTIMSILLLYYTFAITILFYDMTMKINIYAINVHVVQKSIMFELMKLHHLMQLLQQLHERLCMCAGSDRSFLPDESESGAALLAFALRKVQPEVGSSLGKTCCFHSPRAATVKFAHSHAFFVSLTFHVEAKA